MKKRIEKDPPRYLLLAAPVRSDRKKLQSYESDMAAMSNVKAIARGGSRAVIAAACAAPCAVVLVDLRDVPHV